MTKKNTDKDSPVSDSASLPGVESVRSAGDSGTGEACGEGNPGPALDFLGLPISPKVDARKLDKLKEKAKEEKPSKEVTKTNAADLASPSTNLARIFDRKGKHPFLTESLIDEFAQALHSCLFTELAAAEVGIAVGSLKQWLYQGRVVHDFLWFHIQTYDDSTQVGRSALKEAIDSLTDSDWMVLSLYRKTIQAKYGSEREDLDYIARARPKDWKAAAYRLKIRNRERYGDGDSRKTEINVRAGGQDFAIKVVDYKDWVLGDEDEAIEVEGYEDTD